MQGSSERGRAQPVLHVSAGVLDALLLPHEPSSFATLMSLLESEAQCSIGRGWVCAQPMQHLAAGGVSSELLSSGISSAAVLLGPTVTGGPPVEADKYRVHRLTIKPSWHVSTPQIT